VTDGQDRPSTERVDGGARVLELEESKLLLGPYGLEPIGTVAGTREDAVRAAVRTGFPVALKVADPRIVHKTARGLVWVGVSSSEDVLAGVDAFSEELGSPVRVLVQPVVEGVEMALGIMRDPGLGLLVRVAAGGLAGDVWRDEAFLLVPFGRGEAARAVRSLRVWALLAGFHPAPRVEVRGLVDLMVALGDLAADAPEVAEVSLDPVLVGVEAVHLVDVKVRLAPAPALDTGIPRRLRSLS
jgi:hypothetical protein